MIRSLESLPERTLSLMGHVGDGMKHMVANGDRWLDTGAKLGALKSGSKIAMKFVRRHPAATVATVVGAGALWYLARRRAKQMDEGNGEAIEGSARRVEAKRAGRGSSSGARKRATRSRQATQH